MYTHLLVTLDGSPRAETVIPHAEQVARAMDAEITLLRVVDPMSDDWRERGAIGRAPTHSAIGSLFVDQAAAYLERVAAQLRENGARVHASVRQGQAAKQIVVGARECGADVIAIATRSRRGINRAVFGSVAEAVLHETNLPVLLIRAG